MASFQGTQTKWNGSAMQSGCWHSGPTMFASGTIEGSRNGSTISGTVIASNWMPILDRYTQYDFPVTIVVKANGSQIASVTSPVGGNWNNVKVPYSTVTNSATSITVAYYCGQTGGCTKPNWPDMKGSLDFPSYNPEKEATNTNNGVVHTTSNTSNGNQTSISAKPDEEIWFDWWGQENGYPEKNEIDYFNVDINTVNNSDGASSVSLTDHYVQNTHISLFSLCKSFNVKIGGTLYFWVNTCTKGGAWLGRTYLGSVTLKKDGRIYIKDGSNKREVVAVYIKDGSGNRQKLSRVDIKDGSNHRKIDVYTTLYE